MKVMMVVFFPIFPDLELKTTIHVSKYHHELSTIYREQPVANKCT